MLVNRFFWELLWLSTSLELTTTSLELTTTSLELTTTSLELTTTSLELKMTLPGLTIISLIKTKGFYTVIENRAVSGVFRFKCKSKAMQIFLTWALPISVTSMPFSLIMSMPSFSISWSCSKISGISLK